MDPELRVYLDQRFSHLDQRFSYLDQRFSAIDQRFDGIDRRFVELDAELRRHFGVLLEQIRHELQLVAEMVVGNTEAIAVIRVRLDAL